MKKWLKVFLIILGIVIGIIWFDTIQVLIFKNDLIFSKKLDIEPKQSYVIKGILISTYHCVNSDVELTYNKNSWDNFECPISEKREIIDETEVCAQALEKFYEDSKYEYYFPCIKKNTVFIKIGNEKIKVVDALKLKITTISELEKLGLKFYKEEK